MASRWLCRLGVLATITAVALMPLAEAKASANGEGTAELVGALPVTAVQALDGAISCTDWATGPYSDQDLWRFRVETGRFVSVVLGFIDEDGVSTSRPVDGIDGGAAWTATPAGWSLASGVAVVDGGGDGFTLARACPATARESAVAGLAPVAGWRAGTGPQPASGSGATTTPRSLAAGTDIAATVTLGATLVLAGLLLLIVRRRPRGRHRMPEVR